MTREKLLLKPHWDCADIKAYIGCEKSKAYEIINAVKKFYGGAVIGLPSCVQRDKVLVFLGTSIERETYILKILKKGGKCCSGKETLQERNLQGL